MLKKRSYIIIAWFVLAITIAFLLVIFQASWLEKNFQLSLKGIPTQGIITSLDPTYHAAVHYSYQVDNVTLNGENFYGKSGFENLRIGYPVVVYYLPSDPNVSYLGSPLQEFVNEIISVLIASIVAPTIIMLLIWFNFLKKVASRKPETPMA